MKKFSLKPLLLFTFLLQSLVFAQGATILDFLKWNIDPVAVSRGGSVVAEGGGLHSIYYNPAHLNKVTAWEVTYQRRSFSTLYLPKDWNYFAAAAAYRFDEKNVLSLHWQRMGFGEAIPSVEQGIIDKRGTAKDFAIGFTYGRKITPKISGGITLKYLRSDLLGAAANGWAFDLGLNLQNLLPGITLRFPGIEIPGLLRFKPQGETIGVQLGAALLNAGPQMYYLAPKQKDPIPQLLRLGFAYNALSSPLVHFKLLFDFEKELVRREAVIADEFYKAWFTVWKGQPLKEAIYHFGLDARLAYVLSLRFGFRYEAFQNYFNNTILTMGFGINLKYFSIQYGKWLDRENISSLYRNSYIIGIRIGNIRF